MSLPPEAAQWPVASLSEQARRSIQVGLAATALGLPVNMDNWDGYPVARQRLLASARNAGANLVVLSGDSHNAWAFDLPAEGEPAGVEFAVQSVTSPGYESGLPSVTPDQLVAITRRRNPALQWANFRDRGYLTVTFTPKEARAEWLFLDTIRQRSTAIASRHAMAAALGSNRLRAA